MRKRNPGLDMRKNTDPNGKASGRKRLVLERHVPALLTWINNKFSADASRLYRERFNIGIADWRIIGYLGVYGTGTSAEMGDFLGMDKGAVSRSVSALQERDFIRESTRDGRKINLCLSKSGQHLYRQVLDIALEREKLLLDGLTQEDIERLLSILNKMHRNLEIVYKYGK